MRLRALAVAASIAAATLLGGTASATCTPAGIPTCETSRQVRERICGIFVDPPAPPCR